MYMIDIFLSSSYVDINEHQLYFINENQIRHSALETPLFVPANVPIVQFTWSEDRFDLDRVSYYCSLID